MVSVSGAVTGWALQGPLQLFSKRLVRCLSIVRPIRSVEVVGGFPFAQSGFEIDVAFVAERLI